jgi:pimeloyl-ACP methyl ester carboxylesterase
VDVGGTAFQAVVLGDGRPTVVFVNGLGSPLEEWALVAPAVAQHQRVVCYDRRPAPDKGAVVAHEAAHMAADLRGLLDSLDVTGPLVLVGHSWGGSVIRRFAHEHPSDVAGLVFVDASHERIKGMMPTRFSRVLYTTSTAILRIGPVRRRLLKTLGFGQLPPADLNAVNGLTWLASGRTSLAEYGGMGPSLRELAQVAPELPAVPTRVLVAGGRPGLTTKLGAKQMAGIRAVWEQAVAGREEVSLSVVPGAGHYISLDDPQAVIAAVEAVVAEVAGVS